jgi:imidazolonepropionase-like amidohydrolase
MRSKNTCGLVVLALAVVCVSAAIAQDKPVKKEEPVVALVGGTLIDGTGALPVADATVLVRGSKIVEAGPSAKVKVPEKAEVIDVRGKFILPGFIDCHIHTTYPNSNIEALTDDDASMTLRALHVMNGYLRSGVTSVRDVGSNVASMKGLMRSQRAGYVDSLRLFPCGDVITVTGGHGDGLKGTEAVNGPWEWRKAVREMSKAGFDHIKVSPTFTLEEVAAAADEAKTLGMRITAHGGGASDTTPTTMTRIAVEGGVQCIEHLNEMEVDVLDLMAKKGVYCVPTMAVYHDLYELGITPRQLVEKRHWTWEMHEKLFQEARKRKIFMGIGTDYVIDPKHYPAAYFDELKEFVALGVNPMETLVTATKNGSIILGHADEIGTIEAGKLADIQVIKGDPLKSFDALGKPEIVIVGGRVHRF